MARNISRRGRSYTLQFLAGQTEMKRSTAVLYLFIASVLWSTGGLLIKLITWKPLGIAGMRAAIVAVAFRLIHRRFHFHWSKPQIGAAIAYGGMVVLFV